MTDIAQLIPQQSPTVADIFAHYKVEDSMTPYYQKKGIAVYCGDLRGVLPSLALQVDHVITDPPYGLSFMEKGWDQSVPGPEYWQAIKNACKPGAMLLAFGGTRTYHRLCCAIEDAGWEIRDSLMWLHGQGFPKAADVGKMIDKAKGAVPATPEAAKWTGWAAALKPAWEPIVLAMKPMDGTQAHNALTWGVAGMNIDAARIGENPGYKYNADRNGTTFHGKQGERIKQSAAKKGSQFIESSKGRWPANLLLDEDAAAQLDAQTGTLTSGSNNVCTKPGDGYHGGMGEAGDVQVSYGDSGGASRFFYCGKATKRERGPGNDHPTVKPLDLMKYLLTLLSTPDGGVILDPFAGSGTTLLAAQELGRRCIGVELTEHNCEIVRGRLHVA